MTSWIAPEVWHFDVLQLLLPVYLRKSPGASSWTIFQILANTAKELLRYDRTYWISTLKMFIIKVGFLYYNIFLWVSYCNTLFNFVPLQLFERLMFNQRWKAQFIVLVCWNILTWHITEVRSVNYEISNWFSVIGWKRWENDVNMFVCVCVCVAHVIAHVTA